MAGWVTVSWWFLGGFLAVRRIPFARPGRSRLSPSVGLVSNVCSCMVWVVVFPDHARRFVPSRFVLSQCVDGSRVLGGVSCRSVTLPKIALAMVAFAMIVFAMLLAALCSPVAPAKPSCSPSVNAVGLVVCTRSPKSIIKHRGSGKAARPHRPMVHRCVPNTTGTNITSTPPPPAHPPDGTTTDKTEPKSHHAHPTHHDLHS